MERGRRVELALLIVVPLLWGSAFVAIRAGILAGAGPFVFAAYRYALATGVTVAVALAARSPRPTRREFLSVAAIAGILMTGVYAALVYWGEQSTPGGLASVFISSNPVWTAVIAFPLLPAERLGRAGAAGICLGFLGVVVLFAPDLTSGSTGSLAGGLAIVAAAACAASGSVWLRRAGLRASGLWNLSGAFAVATVILLSLSAAQPGGFTFPWTEVTVGTLVFLAVGASLGGYGLFYLLLERAGPAHASVVTYLNPVVGVAVGVVALAEGVTFFELGGFALIVVGLAALQWERRPRPVAAGAAAS